LFKRSQNLRKKIELKAGPNPDQPTGQRKGEKIGPEKGSNCKWFM